MKKLILCLIAFGSLALGDTLKLTSAGNDNDGNWLVSPYTGTLFSAGGTTSVNLYCGDFDNHSTVGSTWTVNMMQVSGDLSAARYDTANPANSANPSPDYPVGTQLYEEEAWLFTQLGANLSNTNTVQAIQEAAWHLTSASTSQPANQNYSQWLTLAASDYNKTVQGYVTPDYSTWYVLTDVNATSFNKGNQELLAQYSPGSTIQSTPEPATLLLAGSALIAVGAARRIAAIRKRD